MRFLTLTLAVLAAIQPAEALAGAWTTPEGKIWTKVAWLYLDSDRLFVDSERDGLICPAGEQRPLR